MFCPTCGSEERQLSQYCRSCGTDLRSVRNTLERPDAVTASAISARDQISRVIADKIGEMESADDLKKVAEDVLPQIEKFLESPEERRMRRVRLGVFLSFIGLGAVIGSLALHSEDLLILIFPALIMLFIGLGILVNGLLFTLPRKSILQRGSDQILTEANFSDNKELRLESDNTSTKELEERLPASASVTEHTTRHLANKS
ncbi:MAG TPA: hypothetical protein VIV66_10785 [Pyrinomonadaceae bacterium]